MSQSFLYSYLWPMLNLLIAGIQLTVAVILFRERGVASWLMLLGSVVLVLGQLVMPVLGIFLGSRTGSIDLYMAILPVVGLGALTFAIGLLLYVLRRRGQADRVAELEAILESIQKR